MKLSKRILAILLSLCVALACMPSIFADPAEEPVNLALGKETFDNGHQNNLTSDRAVDGEYTGDEHRWAGSISDTTTGDWWIAVKLGDEAVEFNRLYITWENCYAKDYVIETADDLEGPWTAVSDEHLNAGGKGKATVLTPGAKGKYVRVHIFEKDNTWGVSIYELEVVNSSEVITNLAFLRPTGDNLNGTNQNNDQAFKMVDGNEDSRWTGTKTSDPKTTVGIWAPWVKLGINAPVTFDTVKIKWEDCYGKTFSLQTAESAPESEESWTTIGEYTNSGKGWQEIVLDEAVSATYVRVYITEKSGDTYGVGIWEFEVYNNGVEPTETPTEEPTEAPAGGNLALSGTIIVDSVNTQYGGEGYLANDGDLTTRWQSNATGNGEGNEGWIGCQWDEPQSIDSLVLNWETAHPAADGFKVQVSEDGENWTDVGFTADRFVPEEDYKNHQVDTITLDETATTQYIRVYCFKSYVDNDGNQKDNPSCYEFEVYGDETETPTEAPTEAPAETVNIALAANGGTAFASSQKNSAKTVYANDGDRLRWQPTDNADFPTPKTEYVGILWNEAKSFKDITLYWRDTANSPSVDDYVVEISNDTTTGLDGTWTEVKLSTKSRGANGSYDTVCPHLTGTDTSNRVGKDTIVLDETATAKAVRLNITLITKQAQLSEFEVYGVETETPTPTPDPTEEPTPTVVPTEEPTEAPVSGDNLALDGTGIDCGVEVYGGTNTSALLNDGERTSGGYQPANWNEGDWCGIEFDEPVDIGSLVLYWETAAYISSYEDGGYEIYFRVGGEWVALSELGGGVSSRAPYEGDVVADTFTLNETVTADGIKVEFLNGTIEDHKYAPKLYELEAYAGEVPTETPTEEPTPTPDPTEEPTPTPDPTEEPTPTPDPTETPTEAPTEAPTEVPNVSFDIDVDAASAGDTITVVISNPAMTVTSFTGGIRFDSEKLTCVSIVGSREDKPDNVYLLDTEGEYVKFTAVSSVEDANKNGTVGFAYAGTADWDYAAQVILTATFTVNDGASGEAEFIGYESTDGTDAFSPRYPSDFETKTVTLTEKAPSETLLGDVDLNGEIDASDLTALAKHVGGVMYLTADQALLNADIDGDTEITASDLTALAKHVGGIESIVG